MFTTLFLSAFIAATILPAQSEALLILLVRSGDYAPWLLVMVAAAGNTLGAVVNWWLGGRVEQSKNRAWFPIKQVTLEKAQCWYMRYGRGLLLLSWMPFIGDPITFAAGMMREKFWPFLLLVGTAKTARYAVLASIF